MIIRQPRHPSHLCQGPDSISRTFLEQFVLVFNFLLSHIFTFSLSHSEKNVGKKGTSSLKWGKCHCPNMSNKVESTW